MPLFTDSLLGALIVYGEYTIYAWGGLTKMVERFIWHVTYPYYVYYVCATELSIQLFKQEVNHRKFPNYDCKIINLFPINAQPRVKWVKRLDRT